MITINDCEQAGYYEYKGLSTDIKPTNCYVNSLFLELDTGYFYYFDGTNWVKMKSGDGYSSFKALISRTITEITPEMTKGITKIYTHAFRGCSQLTKASVSEGVTSIGKFAFYYCSTLSNLTLPEGLTTIDDCAFEGCHSLADLNLKSGLKYIGNFAFKNSRLNEITIPNGTLTIGKYAFELCDSAQSLSLPDSLNTIGEGAFKKCEFIDKISIPNGITKIEKETFYFCIRATNLSISNSVKSIGEKAFALCENLGSINLPDNIETLGVLAFSYCSSVTSINLKRVKFIGDGCFKSCTSLPYVSIPNSTGKANSGWWTGSSFADCIDLREVYIENGVTRIGDYTFLKCYSLETINFPGTLKEEGNIGEGAFIDCSSLKSVVISSGITNIADYAFKGCDHLETVDIPSTISYIGIEAFQDTTRPVIFSSGRLGIYNIYVRSPGPPKLGANAFDTWVSSKSNGPNIRVPSGSENSYRNATNWSSYNSHIMSI